MAIDDWIPPENYSEKEAREDWVWDLADGYPSPCIKCRQPMLISGIGPSGSLICEACEPNDDDLELYQPDDDE